MANDVVGWSQTSSQRNTTKQKSRALEKFARVVLVESPKGWRKELKFT